MKLSKPAMMSAFLCPGLGQWAAGQRVLGASLIGASVALVMSPFARFFWAVLRPAECDPFVHGIAGCVGLSLAGAWHVSWPILAVNVPVFAVLYVAAVWHANHLTIPDAA